VYCVADPQAKLIGPPSEDPPVSPRQLLADTLGDRLKIVMEGRSKVFGVALKDRAALLLAGHAADGAYWMSSNGNWITTDFYARDLPPYLRNWDASGSVARYANHPWTLLHDPKSYWYWPPPVVAVPGALPAVTVGFPHRMPAASERNYLRAVEASPFGNELTLEAAGLLITEENLGRGPFPDLLAINLSSNDYVGHAFGPGSLEVEDMTYRTDLQLGEFVDFVNQQLGGRHWIFVLTADHGVAPIPEQIAHWRVDARRDAFTVDSKEPGTARLMLDAMLRKSLDIQKSDPSPIQAVVESQVYLRTDHPRLKGDKVVEGERLVRDWLLEQPFVAAAFTRRQLLDGEGTDLLAAAMRRSFHPRRSGDVMFVLEPYAIQGKIPATHGSPWDYDTHVPLLMASFGTASPETAVVSGRFTRSVSPASIAPTLAALLRVPPPGGCTADPLDEVLPRLGPAGAAIPPARPIPAGTQ
jgi:hypothetical protein